MAHIKLELGLRETTEELRDYSWSPSGQKEQSAQGQIWSISTWVWCTSSSSAIILSASVSLSPSLSQCSIAHHEAWFDCI
jgi:hypothetical protein